MWLQILADITTNNLYSSQCLESGALGVAILASVGSGYYNSINEASGKMTACDLTVTEFNAEKLIIIIQSLKYIKVFIVQ